ncbi:MAG: hypothetical protein IKG30_11130 [Clostridiales bacterium]|nr:hypothetical protein [Clostridiales bacterium]
MREVSSLQNSTKKGFSFGQIITKLSEHPLLLAFILNLGAFLFRIIVFDIKYEVSDDYITDAVLSGAYGTGYDPQLLFGNIILGYFLVFLYKLIPTISFYFIILILLSFISCTTVLYLLFKKKINTITVCIALIFLAFVTDDLYVLVQFTKVASAAGIAGGLLILDGLFEYKTPKILTVILGSLMMISGSMIRFGNILIYCAFLVVAFIFNVFLKTGEKGKNTESSERKMDIKGILIRFVICVVIVGLLYGLMYLGEWLTDRDQTHREFNEYHILRCNITDKTRPDFDIIENDYKELGLDYVDYAMLNSWNFDDRDVYSDETLQKVAQLQQRAVASQPVRFSDVIYVLLSRRTFFYPIAFALFVLALLSLVFDKKRIYSLILILVSFAMFAGLVYYGRIMYRVEWGVYFCAVSCLMAGFDYNENSKLAKKKKTLFYKERSTVAIYLVILTVLLLLTRVPRILNIYNLLNCSDEDYKYYFDNTMLYSGIYLTDKIGFPTVIRKPSSNIIERLENDPDHYYIVDFATGIQDFYFDYDPWIRPEQGLFSDHYAYFGGCTMRHPGEIYALEQNGCDPYNPFKNLTNDNILLVDNWGYEYKLAYIRRYYNSDAEIELVEVIDGYSIWNIYIPDNSGNT